MGQSGPLGLTTPSGERESQLSYTLGKGWDHLSPVQGGLALPSREKPALQLLCQARHRALIPAKGGLAQHGLRISTCMVPMGPCGNMDINIDPSFSRTANADTALSSSLGLDISIALVAAQATYPDQ